MQMDGNEILHRKDELRRAVSDLRDRGLTTAAKFAADLLTGRLLLCSLRYIERAGIRCTAQQDLARGILL